MLQGLGRMLTVRPDKSEVLIYDFLDGRQGLKDRYPEKDYLPNWSASRIGIYQATDCHGAVAAKITYGRPPSQFPPASSAIAS